MRSNDLGTLLVRLMRGGLPVFHGIAKLISGPVGIQGMAAAAGFPAQLGGLVYAGEFIAPLLLIIGLFARPAAPVIAIDMVVALLLAHSRQLCPLSPTTGAWALTRQAFFLFTALAIARFGLGRIRFGRRGGFRA